MSKSRKLKTPGVYVEEIGSLPHQVVQLPTAITGFVGYSHTNSYQGNSFQNKAVKIHSLMDYERYFGGTANIKSRLKPVSVPQNQSDAYDVFIQAKAYVIEPEENRFCFYESVKWFFQNGGDVCYIISVGTYGGIKVLPGFSIAPFLKGLDVMESISEITLIVIPDAVFLESSDCFQLQEAMVAQCEKLQNRFAILDVYAGNESIASSAYPIQNFRTQLNARALNYAAAYYPWLHTSLKSHIDVDFTNLNERSRVLLRQICEQFISKNFNASETKAIKPYLECIAKPMQSIPTISVQQLLNSEEAHKELNQMIPDYKHIMLALLKQENLMPPSAAMAGIYTVIDKTRGVWKAPANVGVAGVVAASVRVDSQQNEALNVDVSGKSINAIREFPNRGIRVWGARTLGTNLLETRYINTSRTLMSIKQSVKSALKPFAFEPNDQNTWQQINGLVENYLNTLWREGAFAGSKTEQAYFVTIGINQTMTQQDINAGLLKLELGVSFTRPAEFTVIRIVQKMGSN